MLNRLKVFPPAIVVLIILAIAFFATPALLPKETTTVGKESVSMSSEALMAYLQWKHNHLNDDTIRDSEIDRIHEYRLWKDTLDANSAHQPRGKNPLMAYLRWKHIEISDVEQKMPDVEILMNYLQWKHNRPSSAAPSPDDTERLLKYLEWKHIQNPG